MLTVDIGNWEEVKDLILNGHYLHRRPNSIAIHTLKLNNEIKGCIIWGLPSSPNVSRGLCGVEHEKEVIELKRLYTFDDMPKNTESWFISKSIKLLPNKYKILISYAEPSHGHRGVVYQASNWTYVGLTANRVDYKKKGKHVRTTSTYLKSLGGGEKASDSHSDIQHIRRPRKHRYVYFRGTKVEKKHRLKSLKYAIKPYAKEEKAN